MSDQQVKPGLWRLDKGGIYEVLFCATHTETEEAMVVYRALYGDRKLWVHPASMWFETIPSADGAQRFTFLGTSDCKKCLNPGCAFRGSDWTPDPAVECFGYEPPVTKADRIRSMNNEELAASIAEIADCVLCETKVNMNCRFHHGGFSCQDSWLEWLRQEDGEILDEP